MNHPEPSGTPAVAVEATEPTWVRWQIVALLVSFSFMTWFNRVSMSVAYDERIKSQFDSPAEGTAKGTPGQAALTEEAMGYVYSAFLFTYMVCMTPGGWFIDRFGAW